MTDKRRGSGKAQKGDVALGIRIRRYRDQLRLDRATVAHQVGRSLGWLFKVETGRTDISYSDLVKLAEVLRVDVGRLISGDEEGETPLTCTVASTMSQQRLSSPSDPAMIDGSEDVWTTAADWLEELKRRAFLQALSGMAGGIAWMATLPDPAIQALDHLRLLEGSEGETVDALGELLTDLGIRFYLEPPERIQPRASAITAYAGHLLTICSPERQGDLLHVIGRSLAIAGNAQFDLADLPAARLSARAAYAYGQRTGDGMLLAWVRDFQGMMVAYAGDHVSSLRYIEEGLRHAPHNSGIAVRLLGGSARAHARMGQADETLAVLRQAETEYDKLADSEVNGGIFGIGSMQVPYIASSATIWLDMPDVTAAAAQEVIDFDSGPGGPGSSPTRLALARINLAVALAQQRQVDEACHVASLALDVSRQTGSVLLRASDLHARLARQWPDVAEVRAFGQKTQLRLPPPTSAATSD